jgi:hypothetical protein
VLVLVLGVLGGGLVLEGLLLLLEVRVLIPILLMVQIILKPILISSLSKQLLLNSISNHCAILLLQSRVVCVGTYIIGYCIRLY